jgi:uncharacterized protein (DUF1330 family)
MNLILMAAIASAAPAATVAEICDNKPVLMVVYGPTHDRDRMIAYGKAIADSGLYKRLGGYYINAPRPIATFEGSVPPTTSLMIVRFPCLANARAFWYSKEYQNGIKPMRLNPSAGDYVVAVYPEIAVRPDMTGKVGDNSYQVPFDAATVEQIIQP